MARRTPQDDVRAAAGWIVDRTLSSLAPVDDFLETAQERHEERDRALLRELVLGTLRWLRRIDHVLATASNRPISEIEQALRAPLRIGVYQLLFLDRVPAHAAVNEAVEQARQLTHRGGVSFANAVLRRIARTPRLADWPVRESDPIRRLAIEMSHPDFLVRRWVDRFGLAATRDLLEANNRPKPVHLLAFRDRGGRELLAEALIDESIEVEPSTLSPLGLKVVRGNPLTTGAFERGEFYVQDEVSQVAAVLPPPREGERVLDLAAAPGGKSLAILAHRPTVRLVAADLSLARLQRLRANLDRLQRRLPILVQDAGLSAIAGQPFDRVVVDLPCTGTGTLRKHPEIKWRVSEEEVGRLSKQALRMLTGASSAVVAGGLLVAITCSLEDDENERVVERFLDRRPEFRPLDLAGRIEPPLEAGIQGPGLWRMLTGDDHDGFTVQVLERKA